MSSIPQMVKEACLYAIATNAVTEPWNLSATLWLKFAGWGGRADTFRGFDLGNDALWPAMQEGAGA